MARPEIVVGPPSGDDLIALLEGLRRPELGFSVGVREHLAAQQLAAACFSDADGDHDPVRLRNWLAPILCHSPEQQRDFYRVYHDWWKERVAARERSRKRRPATDEAIVKKSRPWKWVGVFAGLVALGAAAWLAAARHFERVEVPVVAGRPLSEARAALEAAGLRAEARGEESDRAAGSVLRQEPAPRTRVRRGSPVGLVIAREPVVVPPPSGLPDLAGLDSEEALRRLASLGLSGTIAGREPSELPTGTVLRQERTGSSVKLWVAVNVPRNVLEVTVQAVDLEGRRVSGASVQTAVRLPHESAVTVAVFSPDGARVLTGSADGTAQVWDAASGRPVGAPLRHDASVGSGVFIRNGDMVIGPGIGFTQDGRLFLGTSEDGSPILRASQDGTTQVRAAGGGWHTLQNAGRVTAAAFSPDGGRVVTGAEGGAVRVWDVATGEPFGAVVRHDEVIRSVSFSPDGKRIAAGSSEGTARVWTVAGGQTVGVPLRHQLAVRAVSFSSDGTRIVTGSEDRTARVWDAATGKPLGSALRHPGPVTAASFGPSSTRLLTACLDGGARIWDLSSAAQTDASGEARLGWKPPRAWDVAVHHPDYQPAEPFAGELGPGRLTLRGELTPRVAPPSRWIAENMGRIRTLALFLPVLAAVCWTAWTFHRRRLVLDRRASSQAHDLAHVRLPEPKHQLYRGQAFVRARIEARRRQTGGAGELDVDATLDRTIRRLGFFSPAWRPRSRLPAYLALVDRAGFRDQQARVVEEFLNGLREGGVAVDTYFFDRDPRLSSPGYGSDDCYRSLWELSALHSEHRLLVFADGSGLEDPLTGRASAWTHAFSAWSERALLTPVPACHWSAREVDLAGTGFRVVPFTPAGLRLFLETMEPSRLRPALLEWHAPYPALLAEQPGRWLERRRPRPEELDELCWQLRAYLREDGFRWLSALAAYPDLDWFLTLYIGLGLHDARGVPLLGEESLLALSRLPWLRHGHMPDWLRLRLVSELGKEDRDTVRALLRNLLRARLNAPGSRFQIDLARPPEDTEGRRWRRFFTDLVRTEPSESPLHDYVFVEFLLGRRPKKLQVSAPQGWRRWVYHRGMHALGVTPVAVMGAALLVGGGANLAATQLADWRRDPEFTAVPSRITQTGWTPAEGIQIPDVLGQKYADASRALVAARLAIGWFSSTAARPSDEVTAQIPEAGAFASAGTQVELRTTRTTTWPPPTVTVVVPTLAGMDLAAATVTLGAVGLKLALATNQPSQPHDLVQAQLPPIGAIVPRGTFVQLLTAAAIGGLEIVGYPPGASPERLSIDGVRWDGKNPLPLKAGPHVLAYDAGQFGIVTRNVNVMPNSTTRFTMPAEAVPWRPRVTSIGPTSGTQGQTVRLTIHGSGLAEVRSVTISGTGVKTEPLDFAPDGAAVTPGDDGTILLSVRIEADAPPGRRTITLTDTAGRTFSPDAPFTVQERRVDPTPTPEPSTPEPPPRAQVARILLEQIAVRQDGSPSATRWVLQIAAPGGPSITTASYKFNDDSEKILLFRDTACMDVPVSREGQVLLQISASRPDKGERIRSESVVFAPSEPRGYRDVTVVGADPRDGWFIVRVRRTDPASSPCINQVVIPDAKIGNVEQR